MRIIRKLAVSALFLTLVGCAITRDYAWTEYPIAPTRISSQISFSDRQTVRIVRGKSDHSKIFLGSVGAYHYYGSAQSLADAIIDQLSREMRRRHLEINDTAEKSLEITVNRMDFETGTWNDAATIECAVKCGNGLTRSYIVRNSTPNGVERSYDGAVALAVIKIMNDEEVLDYIKNN